MSTPVLTCRPSDRIDAVLATMTTARIRHFPVIEGQRTEGHRQYRRPGEAPLDEKELEASVLRDNLAHARLNGTVCSAGILVTKLLRE